MKFLFEHIQGSGNRLCIATALALRFGQRTLVYFLILIQWDSIDLHGHSGYHVWRFLVENKLIEGFNINFLVTDDVSGNELSTALFVKGLYGGILDTGEFTDDSLYLLQFDAETANLHLSVTSANELYVAAGEVTHDVTRAIDTTVFLLSGERI